MTIEKGTSGRILRMEQPTRPHCIICLLDVLPGDSVFIRGQREVKTSLVLDTGEHMDLFQMVPALQHRGCGS